MPSETATAICCMTMGGVLEQFPRLKVCFAHGGGAFPFTLGRIAHGHDVRPDLCAVENPVNPRSVWPCFGLRGGRGRRYGMRQKECNKRAAAALETMAACAPLFPHQKHRTLMAAPQCATSWAFDAEIMYIHAGLYPGIHYSLQE